VGRAWNRMLANIFETPIGVPSFQAVLCGDVVGLQLWKLLSVWGMHVSILPRWLRSCVV
jgi:hypothetical protein